jgi:hypothetical protein
MCVLCHAVVLQLTLYRQQETRRSERGEDCWYVFTLSRLITILTVALALDDSDIQILKTYVRLHLLTKCRKSHGLFKTQGQGPYATKLKSVDIDIKEIQKRINEKLGQSNQHRYTCLLNTPQVSRSLTLVLHRQTSGISQLTVSE